MLSITRSPALAHVQVVQRLQGKYSFNQVHNALNAMANEGVVFNTTGDDHWKLAST